MNRFAWKFPLALSAVTILYYGWNKSVKTSESSSLEPVKFGLIGAPYSMDPMEYNAFVHHVTIRPVFLSLVSQYKSGTIVGQVAESWSNSDDLSNWIFYIRPDLRFANGDIITPDVVRRSLTRIAYLQHNAKSASGLTEHLKGIDTLKSASGTFAGIDADEHTVTLRFNQPQEKLLEAISFGLYSITHPSDYDATTGRWKNPKFAITSGAYDIAGWTDQELRLRKRDDAKSFMARIDSPREVKFVWSSELIKGADVIMGPSLDAEQHRGDDYFGSGAMTTSIYYIHLLSWNDPQSPLNDRRVRLQLRKHFYDQLTSVEGSFTHSFLPAGVTHAIRSDNHNEGAANIDLASLMIRVADPRANSVFAAKLSQVLNKSLHKAGVRTQSKERPNPKEIMALLDPSPRTREMDILALYTNILVEDPIADVRFMITSKEGIKLPDPTGRLKAEAAKERPDFAKINDILWDDGIIWPVAHFSSGLWAKKGVLDFSQINLSLPPTDISWIGVVK